ncbi:integral membrane protein [Xylariaceae sp. FL0662B]|nr:integral membrane protein [Xylariaceae sp. FL0662B]
MSAEDADTSNLDGDLFAYGGDSVIACSIVFAVLCTVFLALRFISHRVRHRPIYFEDWLMIPTWFIMMGLIANIICSVKLGDVGRHTAYVTKFEPEAMVKWGQILFATEIFYGMLFPLEKTSILLLYLRIFYVHRWFRWGTYALIAYIWVWGITEEFIAIFLCKPVAYQWDQYRPDETPGASCLDQLAYYRWVSVPNVIHDVAMIIVPVPMIWRSKIATRQKLAVSCVFLLACSGCVASFIRISLFFSLDAFSDTTWVSIKLMSWTIAEPGVIFICACMPSLWSIIVFIIPSIGSLRNRSGNGSCPHGTIQSKRRGDPGVWSGHGRGLISGTDDFIPLNNVEESVASCEVVGFPAKEEEGGEGSGISVTKEFSWVAIGGRPASHDINAQAGATST